MNLHTNPVGATLMKIQINGGYRKTSSGITGQQVNIYANNRNSAMIVKLWWGQAPTLHLGGIWI